MRSEPVNDGLWAYHHGCGRFLRRFRSASERCCRMWSSQGPTRQRVSSLSCSPLLPVYAIHIVWIRFRGRAPVSCSHSSTSSVTTSQYISSSPFPCSCQAGTQKHAGSTPIKGSQRIKPPTGGPLLARPRILATNPQIDTCSSTSPRSMHAVGTGARLFHSPPPCTCASFSPQAGPLSTKY
jgi:hypothetical protein